jgi:hypothetical protein
VPNGTSYFPVTGSSISFSTEAITQQPMGSAATLLNIAFILETDPGSGKGWDMNVRRNGTNVMSVTCLSGGGGTIPKVCSTSGTATFAAGDLISVQFVGNGGPGGKPISFRMTFGP